MKNRIHNLKYLKENRKSLRNNGTSAEAFLWNFLKSSQLGRKFRRQHSIGNYIVAFYCPAEKLVVELDGAHHFTEDGQQYDNIRTEYLKGLGIRVIRFENRVVFEQTQYVLDHISDSFSGETVDANNSVNPG